MRIGVITVKGPDFHPNARLIEAARERGHELSLINPYQAVPVLDQGYFSMMGATPLPHVILPRQGSPMGEYGFVILNQFQALGVPLVSGIRGVAIARNQYITLQALASSGIQVPRSCFITKPRAFFSAVKHLGGYPVVAKSVDGMGGEGVARIDTDDQGQAFLEAGLRPEKGLVVQEFFPPGDRTDLRILVMGNGVAGAMALTPAEDDFRSNVHQQGRAEAAALPRDLEKMALDAARACFLDIAGVDMIIGKDQLPRIIEVNYSPGFRGLEQATGKDIARDMICFLEHKFKLR